jgi:hypothetical protein
MTDEELEVNNGDSKRPTIIRVVHNRENPFVQLNKEALWDCSLSLKATGLWARCMSRPNDWTFNIRELQGKCKEGRKAIDAAMHELIEHGYACRLEFSGKKTDGKFIGKIIEYIFFEFPASEGEKLKQLEIFKKSFHDSVNGNFRIANFRKDELLIKSSTQTENFQEDISPPIPPHSRLKEKEPAKAVEERDKSNLNLFSEEGLRIADDMIAALKEVKPTYKAPKLTTQILVEIDKMIRLDSRDPKLICLVFRWAVADSFWSDKMFKPNPAKYLREKFDQLEMKMNAKPPQKERKFAPCSNTQAAVQALKDKKGAI